MAHYLHLPLLHLAQLSCCPCELRFYCTHFDVEDVCNLGQRHLLSESQQEYRTLLVGSDDTALKMDCSCSRASNTRSGEGCGVANSRGSSFVERSSSPTNFFQNDVRRFLP